MQRGRRKNEVMLLCERHVTALLIRILDSSGPVKLNDLSKIVTSYRTLKALTDRMVKEGVITKELEHLNYATMFLELTPKGKDIAMKLKEAVNIFQCS